MKHLLVMLLFISFSSYGEDMIKYKDYLNRENPQTMKIQKAVNYPEIYLENDSILEDFNEDTAIYDDAHFTGREFNRLSFSFHFSHDYEDFSKVTSVEAQYLMRVNHYRDTWWGLMFKRTTGKYSALAEEFTGTGSGGANANSSVFRYDNQQTFTSIGFGAGYRFKFLSNWNKSERVFEKVAAFLTYNLHNDSTDKLDYTGWGYTADYGLHYRSSKKFFWGGKISYNFAAVVREAISTEDKPDRSLVFGWTSLAFEMGYYY
jgi:hypothetical protein